MVSAGEFLQAGGRWINNRPYSSRPCYRQVLRYLTRYTHRVAISNRRLAPLADGFNIAGTIRKRYHAKLALRVVAR